MWSNLKVRTCITLVLGLFLVAMLVSNGMAWLGMSSSNDKLERVNNAYSNQAVPAYDAYVMLLRARLNIVSSMMDLQEGRLKESADTLAHAQRQAGEARERFEAFLAVAKASSGADRVGAVETAFHAYLEVAARQMEAMQNQRLGEFVQLNPSAQRLNTAFDTAASAYLDRIDTDTDALVDDARAEHLRANTVTLVLIVLALALCAGCGVFIGRAVLRPLKEAGQHFDRIAAGDLTARVDVRNSNEIGQLFAGLKRMEESLTRTVAAVRRGVDEINVGSREISAGNTDLSSHTEEQAASLEETAASMEQLASTVKQNADNARQANQLAGVASDVAERGGSAVSEVVTTMQDISASSRKISEIVSVIDGIAFQTNILALNAAVEAARAGEQGQGFRGGGGRGALAGAAQRPGGQGDQGADRGLGRQGRHGFAAGRARRRDDAGDRGLGQAGDGHHGRDLGGLGRAVQRDRAGQPRGVADGRGDAAERGAGGRGRGGGRLAAGAGAAPGRGGLGVQDQRRRGDRRIGAPAGAAAPGAARGGRAGQRRGARGAARTGAAAGASGCARGRGGRGGQRAPARPPAGRDRAGGPDDGRAVAPPSAGR
ncbi:putative methyl-accepting chemotaxis protein II [Bordetella pertussis H934]|nr:putative methyl-accepting chemotaxis protein II [Bordetella pertussis H934]